MQLHIRILCAPHSPKNPVVMMMLLRVTYLDTFLNSQLQVRIRQPHRKASYIGDWTVLSMDIAFLKRFGENFEKMF